MLFFCQEPQPIVSVNSEPAVEAAAIAESVGEIHQHPHHGKIFGEFARPRHVGGVKAAWNGPCPGCPGSSRTRLLRGREIASAVDREHQRELLAGERKRACRPGLLHQEELDLRRPAAARSRRPARRHVPRDQMAIELAVLPQSRSATRALLLAIDR